MAILHGPGTQDIHIAIDIIRASKKGVVLTGAGISTPSGIPDFRSPDSGLWHKYNFLEVATLEAFRHNPENFYRWLRPLCEKIVTANPNPAHYAIARLEQEGFISTVVTQNIDGLHQKAGSQYVLEAHGSLQRISCTFCFKQLDAQSFIQPYIEQGIIPRCPVCNQILKPDIILFGEQLPANTWTSAKAAIKSCDLIIVAGSSLEVLPIARLPLSAVENGARLIIINQSPTYLNERADAQFINDVAEIFPLITKEVIGE
jgi:NAD-dependent deacetylase